MPCERMNLGNGAVAIVCTGRRRRELCKDCNARLATKLCDFPLTGSKAGKTCDRPLCDRCAHKVGSNKDYCGPHFRLDKPVAELDLLTQEAENRR